MACVSPEVYFLQRTFVYLFHSFIYSNIDMNINNYSNVLNSIFVLSHWTEDLFILYG